MEGVVYYGLIVLLMALESSFFPFPSEVVIPPAGYLASKGDLNLLGVIFAGVFGSILGALFNYYLSYRWGRPAVVSLGTKFGFSDSHLRRVERFFSRHGEITTFIGRLLPGIRQYISLPAGLGRMDLGKFILYTTAGAGIWVIVLALIGFYVGSNEILVKQYLAKFYPLIFAFVLVLIGGYIWLKRRYC